MRQLIYAAIFRNGLQRTNGVLFLQRNKYRRAAGRSLLHTFALRSALSPSLPPPLLLLHNKLSFHLDEPISRNSLSTLYRPLISRNIVLRTFLLEWRDAPQKPGTVISSDVLVLFNICELRPRNHIYDHPELALLYSTFFSFALDVNYVSSSKVESPRPDNA